MGHIIVGTDSSTPIAREEAAGPGLDEVDAALRTVLFTAGQEESR